jgi:hypothetical protein
MLSIPFSRTVSRSRSLSLSLSPLVRAFVWARGVLHCLLNRFQSHKKAKSTEVTGLELRPIAFSFCAQHNTTVDFVWIPMDFKKLVNESDR